MPEPAVERIEVGIADRQQGQVNDMSVVARLPVSRLQANLFDQSRRIHHAFRVSRRGHIGCRAQAHAVGQHIGDGVNFQPINDDMAILGHLEHPPQTGERGFLHPPVGRRRGESTDLAKAQRRIDYVTNGAAQIEQIERGAAGKTEYCGLIHEIADQAGRLGDQIGRCIIGQTRG